MGGAYSAATRRATEREDHSTQPPRKRSLHGEYDLTKRVLYTSDGINVYEALHRASCRKCAIQCFRRLEDDEARARQEIAMLRQLSHVNILSLVDVVEDDSIYLVLEYVDGGDLFDRIAEKVCYREDDARRVVAQLLMAVQHCHSRSITHNDLRPEDILLTSNDDDATIKLTGFCHATTIALQPRADARIVRGTPGYVAPEILHGGSPSAAADMWSVGVIAFMLLSGTPPFYGATDAEIIRNAKIGVLAFELSAWELVSSEAKDFVLKAMIRSPVERWNASQLLEHKWIQMPQ